MGTTESVPVEEEAAAAANDVVAKESPEGAALNHKETEESSNPDKANVNNNKNTKEEEDVEVPDKEKVDKEDDPHETNPSSKFAEESVFVSAPMDDDDKDDNDYTVPRGNVPTSLQNWATTLFAGCFLVPSYWRGTWTLFDLWLCDMPTSATYVSGELFCFAAIPEEFDARENSAWKSCWIGWGLTLLGVALMWSGIWRPAVYYYQDTRTTMTSKQQGSSSSVKKKGGGLRLTYWRAVLRWVTVYILGVAAVNLWRGVWYLTDYHLLPDTLTDNGEGEWPLASFWTSSVVGSTFCFLVCCGASLLAPPAIFFLDGPGVNPPPLAVTALSSFYSLTLPAGSEIPEIPAWHIVLDLLLSFFAVPIMVVWFWRGSWILMDYYLWTFSLSEHDVRMSIVWSAIIGMVLLVATSETVFAHIRLQNKIANNLLGRFRTYLLAWAAVNVWRATWYIWDEFLGGAEYWSCWLSHWASLAILTAIGCVSCIVAPASTLGVDWEPHPQAADEPLFSNVPVPADHLFFMAIARQPPAVQEQFVTEQSRKHREEFAKSSIAASINTEDESSATLQDELHESWASYGTGKHPGYSSARTSSDPHGGSVINNSAKQSYLSVQRPDLDRRVSSRELAAALSASGVSVRGKSTFNRSR